MTSFDIVLIGAGPASVAALHALDDSCSIAVLTGAAPPPVSSWRLHPKIQAVNVARADPAGVADPVYRTASEADPLFSAAAAGGLANYWGQQFVRCAAGDPWPGDVFDDYPDYADACATIEYLFHLEGGDPLDLQIAHGWQARTPRLLTGRRGNACAGLDAMRRVHEILRAHVRAQTFETRAHSLSRTQGWWHIELETGERIGARQVVLAAGVVGNARLLLRSFPDLVRARFHDHAPWMLYTLGLGDVLAARPSSAPDHFNAVTLERHDGVRCAAFASVYDMRRADLNLLLASTIGQASSRLRGWPAPPGAALIKPVQVWTPGAEDELEIDAATNRVNVPDAPPATWRADRELAAFIGTLRTLGGRTLRVSRTMPGFGFHHHNLRLQPAGRAAMGVSEFLLSRTDGSVVCVDASCLQTIGLRPPTLTAMATARRLVADLAGGWRDGSPADAAGRGVWAPAARLHPPATSATWTDRAAAGR